MVIIILIIFLIISIGLNISAYILIKNNLKKINIYEGWVLGIKEDISDTLETMRQIDRDGIFSTNININNKGIFESDDQVGVIFKDLLEILEKLNQRTQ